MHRRSSLQAGTGWLTATALPSFLTDAGARERGSTAPANVEVALRHVGPAHPFAYAILKGQARALAVAPFKGTKQACRTRSPRSIGTSGRASVSATTARSGPHPACASRRVSRTWVAGSTNRCASTTCKKNLGVAPATSMFFYGKNDRRMAIDWRPEIHDSDGLRIWNGDGEWIWRPLLNPRGAQINTHLTERPRGFGLMQRERRFEQYQDDGVFYEKRPSLWVEPKGDWGEGSVTQVEIPTGDETLDNIVAFWTPADAPQPGSEALFAYRLYWCRGTPVAMNVATVRATRTGIGGIVGQKRSDFSCRFVVDFAGGDLSLLGEKARVEARIWASRGRVEITSARPLVPVGGWRAMFDLVPDTSVEPINLRLFLAVDGQALTETWLYQYTPPPRDQRLY